ncbi:switch-associated protein 70-like isoform X2 [Onthophagus taurus]|uniref:switch-associated protein 70-like isoform X2 n=1 Tax=Onthophagus taurus TaxID=166361 RepID=UPI000C2010BD|nr:switch-associated protein 70-like isoform X2 [Onthophagus taurus]
MNHVYLVLTANIGTLLDLYGVERGLEHYKNTATLDFDQLKHYLQHEVFSSLPDKLPLPELRNYESKIAEICWLICHKNHTCSNESFQGCLFMIFRIFCLLAEINREQNTKNCYQVLLHPTEACYLAQSLAHSLGSVFDEEDFNNLSVSMGGFRLNPFIAVLESRCLNEIKDRAAIEEAVTDIYHTFVEDVIKKGFLYKKGYIFPTMKEYWFVLRPSELTYYKTRSERDKSGSLTIESTCKIEPKNGYKITLQCSERNFELEASNHMTRLQWISALQLAIEHSSSGQSYQRVQATKRKQIRQGRLQEMLRAKALLQLERNARQVAEGQAKELEAVVKEETKKLNELEQIKDKLEKLLEEETQAKRDEEIVRALQARVLAEEWDKREELERLQEEQRVLLDEERGKRIEFEEKQKDKELQLKAAEELLHQLETERKMLDEQLKMAHNKIQVSEETKEILESKLMQFIPLRDGDRIRRAHSFMPSTKDRPISFEVRAATLRRPSKQ